MEDLEQQVTKDIESANIRFRKHARVVKLYESFFEEYPKLLEKAKLEATDKNYDELVVTFHTLKGSASNIELTLIFEMSKTLEDKAKAKDGSFDFIKELYTLKIYGKMYQDNIKNIIK